MKKTTVLIITLFLAQLFATAQQSGKINYDQSWTAQDIETLTAQLGTTVFPRQKIEMLEKALKTKPGGFTSQQSVKLLKAFNTSTEMAQVIGVLDERILGMSTAEVADVLSVVIFPMHKLEILDILRNTITDEDNKMDLLQEFKTTKDRTKAQEILAKVKQPRSYIYGTVTAKKVVFVVDISGSMLTEFENPKGQTVTRYEFVKNELEKALLNLDTDTEFSMVFFSDNVYTWKTDLVPGTQQNVADALDFIASKQVGGATNIWGALKAAFNTPELNAIYFLTDGVPTAGTQTDVKAILSDVEYWNQGRNLKIHATALLSGNTDRAEKKQSRDLMYQLASKTGGVYRAID